LSERGKVGKGAERKVKNHFIDHSYHFIPNALRAPRCRCHMTDHDLLLQLDGSSLASAGSC
jgi:hypothetical protein